MKRQERNSSNGLARFATSTLYMSAHVFSLFFCGLILRFQKWLRKSRGMPGFGYPTLGRLSAEQGGVHDSASRRPYQEREKGMTSMQPSLLQRRSLRVGFLDDNPAILDFLETTLAVDGHTGVRYMEGQSLLNDVLPPSSGHSETFLPPFDLVILDLLLPGKLSGADVFLAIRKHFTAEQLPIIVITAVDELTLEQFRRILPDDVPLLRKPFHPRTLRNLIRQLVGDDV